MRKRQPRRLPMDTVVAVTPRLQSNDCAAWAIKTVTGRAYGEVQQEVVKRDPKFKGSEGLDWDDMIAIAKRLGVKLEHREHVDLETDNGIVGVKFKDPKEPAHAVVLMQGPVIINTDGTVWHAEDYFTAHNARPDEILVVKD